MKTNYKIFIILFIITTMLTFLVGCGSTEDANKPSQNDERVAETVEEVVRGEAFPGAEYKSIENEVITTIKENITSLQNVDEVTINGVVAGYKILVTPNGYGGPMEVFTYIDVEGKVIQVEVGEHGETIGVGDSVTFPEYLDKFNSLNSAGEANLIDIITGATFSAGAVKDGVSRALTVYTDYLR